jgi:hypothetical protein
VETVGNAPTAAILQGSPAPLCCPRIGARGPYRADSCAFSARRNDLICHPGWSSRCLARTAGIEPASAERHSEAQPIDHVRVDRHRLTAFQNVWCRASSCPKASATFRDHALNWWVRQDLNLHGQANGFTARRDNTAVAAHPSGLVCRSVSRTRLRTAYETARTPSGVRIWIQIGLRDATRVAGQQHEKPHR